MRPGGTSNLREMRAPKDMEIPPIAIIEALARCGNAEAIAELIRITAGK